MDLQASKLELLKLIINTDNEVIIEKILSALKSSEKDFWLELNEQEKEEIQIGLSQLNDGHRIPLDEFLKKAS